MIKKNHRRFLEPTENLFSVFGDNWLGQKAESFARFFGTPIFILIQTFVVFCWILINVFGYAHFDLYPFILLNLAFSLQAAYAAPLILLAQTRQSDRDKAHAEADAKHREEISQASEERSLIIQSQNQKILLLLEQNNKITEEIHMLSRKIEILTEEVHSHIIKK
jgi:uncharacterized membrane protein